MFEKKKIRLICSLKVIYSILNIFSYYYGKNNSKSFKKHFFDLFFAFFFRLGKNKKTTVNPLRNNFGKFWAFFFVIGGGIKKNFQLNFILSSNDEFEWFREQIYITQSSISKNLKCPPPNVHMSSL